MADKGSKLNKRVWSLFERAGFSTKPNSFDSTEDVIRLEGGKVRTVDLSAVDAKLGVKIIGWNKQERAKARGLKNPININKASINELMQLPHIGGERAQNIIEFRKKHGGFKSVGELRRVTGIGPKIFKDIEDIVTVE